jgi:predicted amidohydrolase
MRVALAQMDSILGEVDTNLACARKRVEQARADDVDLVVFPELALHGYAVGKITEDTSIGAGDVRLRSLATMGLDVLIGFYEDGAVRAFNSASYLCEGMTTHTHRKLYLPNYRQWEERKHFSPGQSLRAFDTRAGRMATLICNDLWQPVMPWLAVQDGAEVLLIPADSAEGSGSDPLDTVSYWDELLRLTAQLHQCWVIFCNRVGVESGARFWGGSRILDPFGNVVAQAPRFDEAQLTADIDIAVAHRRRRQLPLITEARLGLINREVERVIKEGGDA